MVQGYWICTYNNEFRGYASIIEICTDKDVFENMQAICRMSRVFDFDHF